MYDLIYEQDENDYKFKVHLVTEKKIKTKFKGR